TVPVGRDPATLVAPEQPPVRCTKELPPVEIRRTGSGSFLIDVGQNLVGRLRIRVDGPAGHTIRIRHAEVLQEGKLYTRTLRQAPSVDTLVLDGKGPREWEPRFTFHGFRYAEIEGWDGELSPEDVVARVTTPTWKGPAGSRAPIPCSTVCTRTSCGAHAATSSTCRPTALSVTSVWGGPGTSRSSRPRPLSSSTVRACSPPG